MALGFFLIVVYFLSSLRELNQRLEQELKERAAALGAEIVERGRSVEILRDSEAKTRSILNTAVDGIPTLNEKGFVETFNPAVAATHLYGIAQEAVNNATKHGKAKQILIGLTAVNDRITLTVKGDGLGLPKSLAESNGMGLHIMNYRARMIGATLDVRRDGDAGNLPCSQRRDLCQ